eukprot:CAMPEP_0115116478 /NCGR_PEP_ID=MMETSP0227-20121206/43318_1 /TAXON_ID=89957 /ORGANISM="Polarella glacialis, Strain CCMP 1383" /LENGTH=171 /DNA_ID=CAMNT_0002517361 /DNA_START=51 /DNA_END=563 /DNA_ORIENTATION=+
MEQINEEDADGSENGTDAGEVIIQTSGLAQSRPHISQMDLHRAGTLIHLEEQTLSGGAHNLLSCCRGLALTLAAAAAGAVMAFHLQHRVGLNSVVASAIVGVVAHSFPSPYREIAFAGSFGGMGGSMDNSGPFKIESAFLLGLLKLGTIAFLSGVPVAALGIFFGNGWAPL